MYIENTSLYNESFDVIEDEDSRENYKPVGERVMADYGNDGSVNLWSSERA